MPVLRIAGSLHQRRTDRNVTVARRTAQPDHRSEGWKGLLLAGAGHRSTYPSLKPGIHSERRPPERRLSCEGCETDILR